ncbi:uncharacterized protein LOC116136498 [Pistacia vera]|uniref:uncharacterized protein LOC116136498 n=1 Tax=Pistacia vera TaxID=55513 RepID=UPI001262E56C|nr:uncharacterized protein LOC116136498 [Pistacia vera]
MVSRAGCLGVDFDTVCGYFLVLGFLSASKVGVLVRFLLLAPSVAFSNSGLLFSASSVVFSELCGHIDGSALAPQGVEALSKWEIKDAWVMTWILSSVEPHLVLNLKPYKTTTAIWNYLNTVYNQDNFARRFQLEYEMANFTQGSLSIEEYFSGFQTLWADYSDIVYANVPVAALSAVQAVHATSKRDQFLMKLRRDLEIARSNLMNCHPVPSLDACLSELLCEE